MKSFSIKEIVQANADLAQLLDTHMEYMEAMSPQYFDDEREDELEDDDWEYYSEYCHAAELREHIPQIAMMLISKLMGTIEMNMEEVENGE